MDINKTNRSSRNNTQTQTKQEAVHSGSFFFFIDIYGMKSVRLLFPLILVIVLASCSSSRKRAGNTVDLSIKQVRIKKQPTAFQVKTGRVDPAELIVLAESLVGIPYQFGSSIPSKGLDCSGFIWYLFQRFGVVVPRTSEQFTNAGEEVSLNKSKPGDLILFTGSDPLSGKVGHIGLIAGREGGDVWFIHAASGGNKGVMRSNLNRYFRERFVKVNRIFPD
jgi:cell wall-associated NlpC family hydrolase